MKYLPGLSRISFSIEDKWIFSTAMDSLDLALWSGRRVLRNSPYEVDGVFSGPRLMKWPACSPELAIWSGRRVLWTSPYEVAVVFSGPRLMKWPACSPDLALWSSRRVLWTSPYKVACAFSGPRLMKYHACSPDLNPISWRGKFIVLEANFLTKIHCGILDAARAIIAEQIWMLHVLLLKNRSECCTFCYCWTDLKFDGIRRKAQDCHFKRRILHIL